MKRYEPALDSASSPPPPPGRYRHFKGGEYDVLSVGRHTETDEMVVIYRSAEDPGAIWVRPLEMFVGVVKRSGREMHRFEPIEIDPCLVSVAVWDPDADDLCLSSIDIDKPAIHTLPDGRGGWINRTDGSKRGFGRADRKSDAEEIGRQSARRRATDHMSHRGDGTVSERRSYDKRPGRPTIRQG